MKKGILVGVVLMIASQGGLAADQKKKAPKKSAVVAANDPANGEVAVAGKEAKNDLGDNDYLEAPAAQAAGKNVTATSTVATPKHKWSGSIESRNEFVAQTVNGGDTGYKVVADTAFWMRLNYMVTDNVRVGVGQDLDHNLFGTDKAAEQRTFDFYDNDTFVRATLPSVAILPGNINLALEGRVYIPDSGWSRDTGQVQLRAYGILSKDIGRWSLSYTFIPRPAINTKSVYNYQNPDGSYQAAGTRAFRLTQFAEALYKLSDKVSAYQDLGVDDIISNGGNMNGKDIPGSEASYEILETGVNYAANENLRLTGGVTTYEHNYRTSGLTAYGPETRYFMSAAASFQ